MKKILALFLAMIAVMIVAFPCLAIAETAAQPPDTPAITMPLDPIAPTAQPVIIYTTGADPSAATIDLTPLLQAALSLAVSLITAFLIPWIRAKYSFEQRQRIAAAYQTVVYAAEQMFGAGAGERKLQWAEEQLEARGFSVDRTTLEAEVLKLQSLGKAILTGPVQGTPATTS